MDVRVLRTFVVVAGRRSFTVAADELFLTQSAVSQQIRSLETELGVSLFVRSRTTTELTAAGRSLLQRAEQILAIASDMKAQFGNAEAASGTLRVTAATGASSYLYVRLYERFARAHPDVELDIATGLGPAAVTRVENGDADVVFVQFPVVSDTLDFDVLGESEIVVVAKEQHTPAGVRHARFLVWDGSRELQRFLDGKRDVRIAARTNDLSLMKRFIDLGLGLALVPEWSVREELESGALHVVETSFPPIRQRFGIGYRRGERGAAVDAFLAAANDYRTALACDRAVPER